MVRKRSIGLTFGQLTIVEYSHKRTGGLYYRCLCACGQSRVVRRDQLTKGAIVACKTCSAKSGSGHHAWKGCGDLSSCVFNTYKHHAAAIGVGFTITIEEAWRLFQEQDGRCALTGRLLYFNSKHTSQASRTASLDRIDSIVPEGYSVGNCQWVHRELNKMKRDWPNDEFISICKEVAEYAGLHNVH